MKTKLSAVALVVLLASMIGCASFQSNAGKSLATIASTVDAAMKGWAAYVVASGQVSDSQQASVRDAYLKYQACMVTAQAAYNGLASNSDQTAWNQALAALNAAQGTLVQLVSAFLSPPAGPATNNVGGVK